MEPANVSDVMMWHAVTVDTAEANERAEGLRERCFISSCIVIFWIGGLDLLPFQNKKIKKICFNYILACGFYLTVYLITVKSAWKVTNKGGRLIGYKDSSLWGSLLVHDVLMWKH